MRRRRGNSLQSAPIVPRWTLDKIDLGNALVRIQCAWSIIFCLDEPRQKPARVECGEWVGESGGGVTGVTGVRLAAELGIHPKAPARRGRSHKLRGSGESDLSRPREAASASVPGHRQAPGQAPAARGEQARSRLTNGVTLCSAIPTRRASGRSSSTVMVSPLLVAIGDAMLSARGDAGFHNHKAGRAAQYVSS